MQIADLHRRQWDAYLGDARHGTVGYQGDQSGTKMEHGTNASTTRLNRTDDFAKRLHEVPALMVFYVMLDTLAVTDRELDRQSVVGGGSIYTFVQNVLLGCTAEGLGTSLTTLLAAEQPAVVVHHRCGQRQLQPSWLCAPCWCRKALIWGPFPTCSTAAKKRWVIAINAVGAIWPRLWRK